MNGKANGKHLRFMIDTGASDIMLSPEAASRIGINLNTFAIYSALPNSQWYRTQAPYRLKGFLLGLLHLQRRKYQSINQKCPNLCSVFLFCNGSSRMNFEGIALLTKVN